MIGKNTEATESFFTNTFWNNCITTFEEHFNITQKFGLAPIEIIKKKSNSVRVKFLSRKFKISTNCAYMYLIQWMQILR